jgi:hypothetical protein
MSHFTRKEASQAVRQVIHSRPLKTMTQFEPATITPPPELIRKWRDHGHFWEHDVIQAVRWGAQQAADALRHQWPEPIAFKTQPPKGSDGDKDGLVQYRREDGLWSICEVGTVRQLGCPWLHTPRWQPKRPPTLQEQALAAAEKALDPERDFVCMANLHAALDALRLCQRALVRTPEYQATLTEQGREVEG